MKVDARATPTEKFPESRRAVGIHDGDVDNVVDVLRKGIADVTEATGFRQQEVRVRRSLGDFFFITVARAFEKVEDRRWPF